MSSCEVWSISQSCPPSKRSVCEKTLCALLPPTPSPLPCYPLSSLCLSLVSPPHTRSFLLVHTHPGVSARCSLPGDSCCDRDEAPPTHDHDPLRKRCPLWQTFLPAGAVLHDMGASCGARPPRTCRCMPCCGVAGSQACGADAGVVHHPLTRWYPLPLSPPRTSLPDRTATRGGARTRQPRSLSCPTTG